MYNKDIKVLLIEDNPGDIRLIQEMLLEIENVKVDLIVSDRLSNGLELLAKTDFDIILLDLGLPDSKGLDTFNQVYGHYSEIPIIILTIINDDGMGIKALQEGAQDYLIKGQINSQLLIRAIRYAIERKHAQEAKLKSEIKLRSLMNSATDSFSLWDSKLNLLDINRTTLGFHNNETNKADLIGKNISNVVPIFNDPEAYNKLLQVMITNKPYFTDKIIHHPKFGDIHIIIRVFRVDQGLGLLVTDITERKRAEQALKKSEKEYKELVENALVGVYKTNLNGEILYVNNSLVKILGFKSPHEMMKENVLVRYKDPKKRNDLIKKLQELGHVNNFDVEIITKTGKIRNLLFSASLEGESISGMAIDISKEKKAMKELKESEESYRNLFERSSASITVLDKNGIIIDCNEATERLTGYSKNEIIGKSFEKEITINPNDLPKLIEKYDDLFGKKEIEPFEMQIINNKNEKRWIRVIISRTSKDNKISGIQIISSDITEQKRIEEEVRLERDRAQLYLDIAGVMFVAIDNNGKVTLINKKGCNVLGYKENEIIGKNWFDNFIPKRIKKNVKSISSQLLKGKFKDTMYFENPILTKNGEERMIAWHNNILFDKSGEIIGHLSSGEDITERKMTEEALNKKTYNLERFSKLAIGREKKMIELKKQIKMLKKRVEVNIKKG